MSKPDGLTAADIHLVRDTCLCLRVQRAARTLARRFDDAFRAFGLTNGQFSLLMSLSRPESPSIGQLSSFLAMDRTTLTAMLKPLARRSLLKVGVDRADKRTRRVSLTPAGRALLSLALPVWKQTHAALDGELGDTRAERLRGDLALLG